MLHKLFRGVVPAVVTAVFGTVHFAASSASADLINIQSNPAGAEAGIGSFTGTLNYEFNSSANYWELTVTLTNTSPVSNGGFLTGFIFNIDSSDSKASATLVSGTHPFQNAPNQSGSPFGSPYDAGAALGGNWLGNGNPSAGIAVGATGSFAFQVVASDAASLTAASFMNGPFEYDFLVRFRGFNNGDSDKVPGEIVPGPAVLTVLAMGLILPIGRRRRP